MRELFLCLENLCLKTDLPFDVKQWEEQNVTCIVLLPEMVSVNLITSKQLDKSS